jgi:hypothetical protein
MNRLTRLATIATAVAMIATGSMAAGITADTLTLTFTRVGGPTYSNTTDTADIAGSVKVLTNCLAMVGTATQDLTGVSVNLWVGNSTTATCFTGTVQDTTNGLFTAKITLPAIQAVGGPAAGNWYGIVLELTNATDAVTYPDEKRRYLRQRLR